MATPQPGIFAANEPHQYHLEYRIPADSAEITRALRAVAATDAARGQSLVLSFGKSLWTRLVPDRVPTNWHDFATIEGRHRAPSTQADLWVWLQGPAHDANLARALQIDAALGSVAERVLDLPTFVYLDSLDLTGFVDGTANPKGDDRMLAGCIPETEIGAGGSFALTQRYVHGLKAFWALPIADQERVIGRTKVEDEELEGDAMPPDSHVSRTDFKLDGVAFKIWRRSTPYGTVSEHGLQFVAFACEQRRLQVLLERMFGTWPDGGRDRLMDFSTAVTGSYWLTPCQEDLAVALEG